MKKSLVKVIPGLLLLLITVFPGVGFAGDKDALVFGVHPFKKPTKLVKMFKPVKNYLSQELNREIKIVITKSYGELGEKYQNGEVDFGYMGPSIYAVNGDKGLVKPLARIVVNGKGTFQGVIVVKKDSPYNSVSDLKGKSFAFGSAASTLSHYVPHHMLMKKGIYLKDLSKYAFVGHHDNVAINVLNGNFDAGGLKPGVAKNYLDKGLRILAESEPVPEHLFVANAKLDDQLFKKIKAAIMKADTSVLKSVNSSITGLEEASPEDYADLRKLMHDVDNNDPAKH